MIMFKLIENEIIKIIQRRKSLVTVIAFALLVGVIGFGTYKEIQRSREWSSPAKQIEQQKRNIASLKESKGLSDDDPEIKMRQAKINELEKIQRGEKKFDWKEELTEQNKSLKESLASSKDKEQVKLQIQSNEYLLEHNITPQWYDYKNGGTRFLMILFNILGLMFLAIGIILFGADMVSGEFTPPTAKFLLTQPVSRGKILFSKLAALFITTVMLIIPIELIAFLIMGALFGFGNMNYPVIVGSKYVYDMTQILPMGEKAMIMTAGSGHIITMGQYIIRLFLMQILFILVAVTFTIFISTVIKSSMISMSTGIVSVIAALVLQEIPTTRKLSQYIFTNFGRIDTVLDGSIAIMFNNPSLTLNFVLILFAIWTIVTYAIAHFCFTKNDILI